MAQGDTDPPTGNLPTGEAEEIYTVGPRERPIGGSGPSDRVAFSPPLPSHGLDQATTPPPTDGERTSRHGRLVAIVAAFSVVVGAGIVAVIVANASEDDSAPARLAADDDVDEPAATELPPTAASVTNPPPTGSKTTEPPPPTRDYDAEFATLFAAIVRVETLTESYVDDRTAIETDLFSLFPISPESFADAGLLMVDDSFERAAVYYDEALPRIADLEAIRLSDPGLGPLDEVRDAAVDHFRVWTEYPFSYVDAAYDWVVFEEGRIDFYDYVFTTAEDEVEEVTRTFEALCSLLSDHQPADGSFTTQIAATCTS